MTTTSTPVDRPAPVRQPPGPRLPKAVQTLLWLGTPVPFMRWCRHRYGDVFRVDLPIDGGVVNVCDPELVRSVFTGDPDQLRAGEANVILEALLGSRSVLLLDGPEHLRQRRLMLPPFHGERMQRYGTVMAEIAAREVAAWRPGPMTLEPAMQRITLEVILRTVFGLDGGLAPQQAERGREPARGGWGRPALPDGDDGGLAPQQVELRDRIRRLLDAGSNPLRLLPGMRRAARGTPPRRGHFARIMALKAAVDEMLYEEIARRRGGADLAERDDILSMLLLARDDEGRPMTDLELRDELMTLLAAGHETTATALAWFFELVLRHPRVEARLRADLARGDAAYLDAAIKESMRLRPVVPVVVRRLHAPLAIGDVEVPDGGTVACNIVLSHLNPEVYPDPRAFLPERFLERAPDTYSWIPFGGGIRRCLGASFAHFEMRTVIPVILDAVRMRHHDGRPERVRRRAVTMVPARRARVIVERVVAPAGAAEAGSPAAAAVPVA